MGLIELLILILLIAWLLGAFAFPVGGSLIHVLVVLVIVLVLVRVLRGRRVL